MILKPPVLDLDFCINTDIVSFKSKYKRGILILVTDNFETHVLHDFALNYAMEHRVYRKNKCTISI